MNSPTCAHTHTHTHTLSLSLSLSLSLPIFIFLHTLNHTNTHSHAYTQAYPTDIIKRSSASCTYVLIHRVHKRTHSFQNVLTSSQANAQAHDP